MNIQKLNDSEALVSKLGIKGVHQFLNLCGPCTGDYAVERHEWIDDLPDIDTLAEEAQQTRETQHTASKIIIRTQAAPLLTVTHQHYVFKK